MAGFRNICAADLMDPPLAFLMQKPFFWLAFFQKLNFIPWAIAAFFSQFFRAVDLALLRLDLCIPVADTEPLHVTILAVGRPDAVQNRAG